MGLRRTQPGHPPSSGGCSLVWSPILILLSASSSSGKSLITSVLTSSSTLLKSGRPLSCPISRAVQSSRIDAPARRANA